MDGPDIDDLELLAALAPMSVRAALDAPDQARSGGRRIDHPLDVGELVDQFEHGLFASPISRPSDLDPSTRREVAASIAFQAVVAQVANPVLLANCVLGVGLAPTIAEVRWRPDGWAVRYGLDPLRRHAPGSIDEVVAQLRGGLVDPWRVALTEVVDVPERVLHGNADAAIWTAVVAVHRIRPLSPSDLDGAAAEVLGPLRADGDGCYTRDTCCLIHRAGLAPCDECPLSAPAST